MDNDNRPWNQRLYVSTKTCADIASRQSRAKSMVCNAQKLRYNAVKLVRSLKRPHCLQRWYHRPAADRLRQQKRGKITMAAADLSTSAPPPLSTRRERWAWY